jgi:hypothetical protein
MLGAIALAGASCADEDTRTCPVEVENWSIWVGSPSQNAVNAQRTYRNAMPEGAGTVRPRVEEKDLAGRFPIAPISIVQFFGEPTRDVDVELRVKTGTLLSHWPVSKERSGRLQWFKSDLSASPLADLPVGYLPEGHWLQALRAVRPALYLRSESRVERFLAFDAEITMSIPLKIRGGPEEYTLQNLTGHPLRDVAVIAPTDDGYRVGWLDQLPTAAPGSGAPADKEKEAGKRTAREKAERILDEATAPRDDDKDAATPLPAEGDAAIRARVDQALDRPVAVGVEQAPLKDVLSLIAGQARLQLELDEHALSQSKIEPDQPTSLKAEGITARDALSDVLGRAGLSYRITASGGLFITTSARLTEEPGGKRAVLEGPPIQLTLSQPLKPSNPSYRELTRDALARRLAGQGLREESVQPLLDRYAQALFEPGELIVLAHLSPEAIDEAVLLDVFPPPKRLVRTTTLVVHGVDPRLQDRARALVQQLGDLSPRVRETAEARLLELGSVAVPALEDALNSKDVEAVYRAERLLLRLDRPVP